MIPAETKAKELIDKFTWNPQTEENLLKAKACALICVEEMIKIQQDYYCLVLTQKFRDRCNQRVQYLEQVKEYLTMEENEYA